MKPLRYRTQAWLTVLLLLTRIPSAFSACYEPLEAKPLATQLSQVLGGEVDPGQLGLFACVLGGCKHNIDSLVRSNDGLNTQKGDNIIYSMTHGASFQLRYRDTILANVDVYVLEQTLRFDITVLDRYRGIGAYSYAFNKIVSRFPELVYVPSRLPVGRSDNATLFLNALYGPRPLNAFPEPPPLTTMSAKEIRVLRAQMLSAYYESTPAARVRANAGFSRLTDLTLDWEETVAPEGIYPERHVSILTEKGTRMDDALVRVYVIQSSKSCWELSPSGRLLAAPPREARWLGAYDSIRLL